MDIQQIIEAFVRYDAWIHNKIMRPLFRWMQSWFHCNRFQLIQIALVVEALAMAINAILPEAKQMRVACVLIIMQVLIRAKRYWRTLSQASNDFEEGVVRSETVADLMPGTQYARLMRTFGLNFLGVSEIVYPPLWATGLRRLEAWELCIGMLIMIWFIEFHLWDADDVAPKDRKRLFRPAELPT